MASGTANHAVVPPPPPIAGESRQHEQIIQQQLSRAGFYVKLVDLASHGVLLLVGVLAFFLLMAFVDHWLVPLGTVGRLLALVVLLGGAGAYFAWKILPLLLRSINPTYAARTIEESAPRLKNSLINFLLLRGDRGVRGAVYAAVEQRAAQDIALVPVETAVDHSQLIRLGYMLVAMMAAFGLYKVLSPKDPFQTVARVVTPWADIARPSRVQISDVTPGDAEVYHGRTVAISAVISGTRTGESVLLEYSTANGQVVDRQVPMTLAAGGLRHECLLPADDAPGAQAGVQQDLTYRIVAGDAATADYKISVIAAPTIVVQKIEYAYPAYTQKPPLSVEQQGDIAALEGTLVTIHALSNQPIAAAALEFDPSGKGSGESLPLKFEGNRAWGSFRLQLQADRQTPWRSTYQVRFINERQQWSEQPILHRIEVQRDLDPEVQLLAPTKQRIEIPLNGSQTMEVRAIDPDFALSSVRVQGIVAQREVLQQELLPAAVAGQPAPTQITAKYEFRPAEHKLAVGDELIYWAVAADNRTSATGSPEPNLAQTAEYVIRILPPTGDGERSPSGQKPGAEDTAANDPAGDKPPMPKSASPQPEEGKTNPSPENNPDMPPKDDKNPAGEKGDQNKSDPKNGEQKSGEQKSGEQKGDQQKSGGQKGDQQKSPQQSQGEQQQPGQGQKSDGGSGGESQKQNQGESSPTSGGQSQGSQAGTPQGGQPMSGDPQSGESGSGDTSGQPSGNSDQKSGNNGGQTDDTSGNTTGQRGPNGKAHEGQLVEEVLKEIQKEQPESGQQPGQQQKPGQGQQGTGQRDPQSPGGEKRPSAGDTQPNGTQGQQPQQQPGDDAAPSDGSTQPGEGANSAQSPKTGQPGGSKGQPSQGPQPDGAKPDGAKPDGAKPDGAKPDGAKPDGGKPAENGAKGEPMPGDKPQGEPDQKQGEGAGADQKQEPGGKPEGPAKAGEGKQSEQGAGEKKDPGAGQTGSSGAGSNSDDKSGTGKAQEQNRDRNKEMQPDSSDAKQGEASAPSGSKKQSDSQGAQSGDQSGGGKKGAGQSAKQEGHDAAGSKSAADEGAGAADQKGDGETGKGPGDKKASSSPTGKSGQEKGDGSSTRGNPGGSEAGKSDNPPGSKPEENSPKNDQSQPAQGSRGTAGTGPVTGGGVEGDRPQVDYGPEGETAAGDAANLEYARKATDLVLNKLKDEEQKPNSELLDRLGWSKEDLTEFIRRWESLKQSADKDPAAARELDESLRSLGLRQPASRKRTGGTASDTPGGLRDTGSRTAPPSKYRDAFDSFRKGAGR